MDDIEKARAAHAALVAAKAACDAAGLTITCGAMRREHDSTDAVDVCIERAESRIASMGRRAVPIAFGDKVTVYDVNARGRAPDQLPVVRVGRTLVHVALRYGGEVAYSIEDGRRNDNYGHTWIDPDDLARIKRDLVGKRPPRTAPAMRDVGTVTKGGDE